MRASDSDLDLLRKPVQIPVPVICYDDEPSNPLVQQYENWLDQIERHQRPGSVLDIGCGTGLFLSVARRRGWEPFGIDDCDEATEHARNHFGLKIWSGAFEDFVREPHSFDLITGWDVIEHARDPVGLVRAIQSCLNPDGVVGLSTPNQRSVFGLWKTNTRPDHFCKYYFVSLGRTTLLALPLPLVIITRWLFLRRQGRTRRRRNQCLKCGYSLTGNVSGICPECGTKIPIQKISDG